MSYFAGAMDQPVEENTPLVMSRAESDDVDEVTVAFKDMMDELGVAGGSDNDSDDLMPSCCFFFFLDCLFLNICNLYKCIKPRHRVSTSSQGCF